ncbi:hypothetical protein KY330_03655 [Candidatus Woesearchaeota archaeon]|nr:hypothetical protein [Candidatus Woesearchaeota archaeon]
MKALKMKLDNLIESFEKYLDENLDLKDLGIEVKIHDLPDSYYSPKDKIVYVPKDFDIPTLTNLYGHALLDKYSFFEQRLLELEEKIEAFKPSTTDNLAQFDSKSAVKGLSTALENCLYEGRSVKDFMLNVKDCLSSNNLKISQQDLDTILKLSTSFTEKNDESYLREIEKVFDQVIKNGLSPDIKKYLAPKQEYDKLKNTLRPIQDGFALWMEHLLVNALGMQEAWSKITNKLSNFQLNALESFTSDLKKKGLLTSLYALGFPKSIRKDLVICYAKEHIDFKGLKLLFLYGSGKRDIDLLAVYDTQVLPNQKLYYDGNLDINALPEKEFLAKLSRFDIEILECIRGQLLLGDESIFSKIKDSFNSPGEEAVNYAYRRAFENFFGAEFFLAQHRYRAISQLIWKDEISTLRSLVVSDIELPTTDLISALNSLAYCVSYMNSAEAYKHNELITFKEILERDSLQVELITYLKDIENKRTNPSSKKLSEFYNKVKEKYFIAPPS